MISKPWLFLRSTLISKINFKIDENDQYVFKTSSTQMKFASEMNCCGNHFLHDEYCFLMEIINLFGTTNDDQSLPPSTAKTGRPRHHAVQARKWKVQWNFLGVVQRRIQEGICYTSLINSGLLKFDICLLQHKT